MPADKKVAVIGASGHTARFVLDELASRGIATIALGRELRIMPDNDAALDRALDGAAVIINCAGPFLDTARIVIEAALGRGAHYLDLTAEQVSARSSFEQFDAKARSRGIVILPAAGFYGGLGDLVATVALGDWPFADTVDIFVALDHWWPTQGTRRTGARNTASRVILRNGKFEELQKPRVLTRAFEGNPAAEEFVELPFTETVLISRHLQIANVHNFLNRQSLRDVRDPDTPAPEPADERGRSNQQFMLAATVQCNDRERSVIVRGRDIYAITAPIVVEAAQRLIDGHFKGGCFALGQIFEPRTFLQTLPLTRLADGESF